MRPFFMSIVSPTNHWMFVASNGGLTAGHKHAELARLPSKEVSAAIRVKKGGRRVIFATSLVGMGHSD